MKCFHCPKGIVIHWPSGACLFNLDPNDTILQCTIDDISVADFALIDNDGKEFQPTSLIAHQADIYSSHDFDWPKQNRGDTIRVVRVHGPCATSQDVRFTAGQTIEDLMRAEQTLIGPGLKVQEAHDGEAVFVDLNQRLERYPIIVLHYEEPHNLIQIQIVDCESTTNKWMKKGTRIFELCKERDVLAVDGDGFELPLDFPIFQSMKITFVQRDDELAAISPTEVFTIHASPTKIGATAECSSVRDMIQHATERIAESVKTMIRSPNRHGDVFTDGCLKKLFQNKGLMGDDEMTFMLEKFTMKPGVHVAGIVHWQSASAEWKIHPQWTNSWYFPDDADTVFVMMIHNHWIPAIKPATTHYTTYWDTDSLPEYPRNSLQGMVPCEMWLTFSKSHPIRGWCGFHAIDKLCENLNMRLMTPQTSGETRIICNRIGSEVLESFRTHAETTLAPCRVDAFIGYRFWFASHVLTNPSLPQFYGAGSEEGVSHQQLKIAGAIAAVLIAKGHRDQEATTIGHKIASLNIQETRQILAMKEPKAYPTILKWCVDYHIQIESISKEQAIRRLQTFFRTRKQSEKSSKANSIDLCKLDFGSKAFMIQNGEFVTPSLNWAPTSRGLAIGNKEEIKKFAQQGKLLSTEANSALSLEYIDAVAPVTCTATTVSVSDGTGNQALLKVYLTHFGAKPVVKTPMTNGTVSLPRTRTISINVFKCHVDEGFWTALMKSPAKTILGTLQDASPLPVAQIWSRRWNLGNKTTEPGLATSFSMLASVDEPDYKKWLQRSGLTATPVYINGKRDPGSTDHATEFRVLWIGKSNHEAAAYTGTIDDHAGLVFKPPGSYGIRIPNASFEAAWKKVKGEKEDMPSALTPTHKFILGALPTNMTGPSLEKWGSDISLNLRVLRKMGDGRFLVGTTANPPGINLSVNGVEILVQKFEDHKKPMANVVAGRLNAPVDDPRDIGDPWFGQKLGGTSGPSKAASSAAPWQSYKSQTSSHQQSVTMEQNNASEQRFHEIESDLKALKDQIAANQSDTSTKMKQMDNRISSISSSMQQSLRDALAEQSKSLISTFENLMKGSPRSQRKEDRSRSPIIKD
eukprot:Skav219168  [mRNA]  locus=scaffold648:314526:317786:+ [translate_table: standard]